MNDINQLENSRDSMVQLLNKSEIDLQVATAHKYPRSIKQFRDETLQLVTLNETIAGECVYSLPRGGKNIEGPSVRFAEIVINSWGNCRCGTRVISEEGGFITAQGVFHDLEKNSAITFEVRRRITDKNGVRYNPDLIAVTANAASAIALRNAALKGVPKAFWVDMYESARKIIMGDVQTLANRRAKVLEALLRYGVTDEIVFRFLGVAGIEDITIEHMTQLFGLGNALKEGETTVEKIVAELPSEDEPPKKTSVTDLGKNKRSPRGKKTTADGAEK